MRWILPLAFGLAACDGLPLQDLLAPAEPDTAEASPEEARDPPEPLAMAALANGAVIVAPPRGYCIDPTTLDTRANRGFALIASCASLADDTSRRGDDPMVVTVAVAPKSAETLPSADILANLSGSALLSQTTRETWVAAHLEAPGPLPVEGADPRHWRAAFHLDRWLVSLALYAPDGSALGNNGGTTALASVRDEILKASPKPDAEDEPSDDNANLLARLFDR